MFIVYITYQENFRDFFFLIYGQINATDIKKISYRKTKFKLK